MKKERLDVKVIKKDYGFFDTVHGTLLLCLMIGMADFVFLQILSFIFFQ